LCGRCRGPATGKTHPIPSHILLLVKLGYTHHFSIPKNKDNAKTNTQKQQADADLQLIWKF